MLEFDHQQMNTFEFVRCSKNDVREFDRCSIKWCLTHHYDLGENFQIMNYGIGGKISGHVDSRGEIIDVNNTVSDNINGK